ncbi:MAG: hypothetical protein ACJ8AW_14475, partial [Rhodopila sp.]
MLLQQWGADRAPAYVRATAKPALAHLTIGARSTPIAAEKTASASLCQMAEVADNPGFIGVFCTTLAAECRRVWVTSRRLLSDFAAVAQSPRLAVLAKRHIGEHAFRHL